MAEYLFLMHDDARADDSAWEPYLHKLQKGGFIQGGGAIGEGVCVRKDGASPAVTAHLRGYIRVKAASFDQAKSLLTGNPVFEAGGTVEIREVPRSV